MTGRGAPGGRLADGVEALLPKVNGLGFGRITQLPVSPGVYRLTLSGEEPNFTPSRPAVEILADYASILRGLYLPERYFGRVLTVARRLRRQPKQLGSTRGRWTEITALGAVIWRLGFGRGTAWHFWRTVLGVLVTRPQNFEAAMQLMALFLHFRRHTRFVLERIAQHIAELDAASEKTGPPRAPAVTPGAAR